MHPTLVLQRLIPNIKYDVKQEKNMDGSNTKTFSLTAYVNGSPYSGQGEF